MRVPNSGGDDTPRKGIPGFGDVMGREKQPAPLMARDVASMGQAMNYSSGGLVVPDGQTRDPFPPSLVAYIEIIRSVTEYLREQGIISRNDQESVAEPVTAEAEGTDVEEPTTFAIGEEEHAACAVAGPTPAIGEATLA